MDTSKWRDTAVLLLQNEKSCKRGFKSEGKVVITLSQTAFQMNSTSAVCQTQTERQHEITLAESLPFIIIKYYFSNDGAKLHCYEKI